MSAGHDPAEAIAQVTHYFSHCSVAAVRLSAPLALGDKRELVKKRHGRIDLHLAPGGRIGLEGSDPCDDLACQDRFGLTQLARWRQSPELCVDRDVPGRPAKILCPDPYLDRLPQSLDLDVRARIPCRLLDLNTDQAAAADSHLSVHAGPVALGLIGTAQNLDRLAGCR
jgi:hypothetical protein